MRRAQHSCCGFPWPRFCWLACAITGIGVIGIAFISFNLLHSFVISFLILAWGIRISYGCVRSFARSLREMQKASVTWVKYGANPMFQSPANMLNNRPDTAAGLNACVLCTDTGVYEDQRGTFCTRCFRRVEYFDHHNEAFSVCVHKPTKRHYLRALIALQKFLAFGFVVQLVWCTMEIFALRSTMNASVGSASSSVAWHIIPLSSLVICRVRLVLSVIFLITLCGACTIVFRRMLGPQLMAKSSGLTMLEWDAYASGAPVCSDHHLRISTFDQLRRKHWTYALAMGACTLLCPKRKVPDRK